MPAVNKSVLTKEFLVNTQVAFPVRSQQQVKFVQRVLENMGIIWADGTTAPAYVDECLEDGAVSIIGGRMHYGFPDNPVSRGPFQVLSLYRLPGAHKEYLMTPEERFEERLLKSLRQIEKRLDALEAERAARTAPAAIRRRTPAPRQKV